MGELSEHILEEDPDHFEQFGRMDWYVTKNWNRLHWAKLTVEHRDLVRRDWGVAASVQLACGRTAGGLWIPGMFTRMGAQRCIGCCRALGYPPGKGSPKNDPACRVLLGLD